MIEAVGPLADALYDTNRYVSGYAAEALERIGTPRCLRCPGAIPAHGAVVPAHRQRQTVLTAARGAPP